jgi:hypothetical protein
MVRTTITTEFDRCSVVRSQVSKNQDSRRFPNLLVRQISTLLRCPTVKPTKWETRMPMYNSTTELRQFGLGKNHQELAQFIEGHINRVANGRIRDLHVVYSDDKIILQGRSRTYHAKQLAHQAVLDLTDGHPLLANQIIVS